MISNGLNIGSQIFDRQTAVRSIFLSAQPRGRFTSTSQEAENSEFCLFIWRRRFTLHCLRTYAICGEIL
ncbi:hypothetical protein A0H81_11464 [Grifola frondosa]|uniref:Uncharacterized protein n=1 Tax=Grifola frondosa TaxID=5627 RepID=A0A1C7LVH0_GRIFR|nr:hypothetical protein A0H81_11464 [Grifola frondosa]